MYNIEYWEHQDLDTLSEVDRKELLVELEAQRVREAERGKYDWAFLNNEEKLEIMKKWYPRAYRTVKTFYPGFMQAPNDFPRGIAEAINRMISNLVSSGDRYALQFT